MKMTVHNVFPTYKAKDYRSITVKKKQKNLMVLVYKKKVGFLKCCMMFCHILDFFVVKNVLPSFMTLCAMLTPFSLFILKSDRMSVCIIYVKVSYKHHSTVLITQIRFWQNVQITWVTQIKLT